MDGVCTEMTTYVLNRLGCPIKPFDFNSYPREVGFDIVEAANRLGPRQWTPEEFWRAITREMWASFPPSQEFGWLLGHAEALVGQENVFFLTSPTRDPDSLAGKLEWIHKHCPKWMHRQFLMGPAKHLCARPDTLLVDDADKNVEAFRAAGGHTILVPRPWNKNWCHWAQGTLQNRFHRLFQVRNFDLA
jgi:hypothetical protein